MEKMEATLVEDGQQPKSPDEVVSNVLSGSNVFLCNVGFQSASKKSSATTVSAKKQEKDGFREEVETLKAQVKTSQETIDSMKKSMEENNSLLRQRLSFSRGQVPSS
ncbi:hypothetical protein BS78_07G044800 [Paspalum vaginatum]|nr:hypothetical protein BS78_07G044800 [Paspalum vaginatum]